ncbi:hypothetical protein Q8F55_007451 [Vanrija albida]|uniref:Uncharacterized protein n=1 Tax=Vanrija albida TaxID=181172 RepID=A0ABR3PTL1_9TREE
MANGSGVPTKRAAKAAELEPVKRARTKKQGFNPRPIAEAEDDAGDDAIPPPPPSTRKIARRRESTRAKLAREPSPVPSRPGRAPLVADDAVPAEDVGDSRQEGDAPSIFTNKPLAVPHLSFKRAARPRPSAAPPPSPPGSPPGSWAMGPPASVRRGRRSTRALGDMVVPLPIADTPIISRNRDMRNEMDRRSSLTMRGKRASSSFGRGEPSYPHSSVPSEQFYRHIDTGIPEPIKARWLISWCAKRAMDEHMAEGKGKRRAADADEVDKLLGDVMDDFVSNLAKGNVDTNVFGDPTAASASALNIRPHPRNVENRKTQEKENAVIKRMKTEDRDWSRIGARANEMQAKVISSLNASARRQAVPDVTGAADFFKRALSLSDEVMAAGDGNGAAASVSNFAEVELEVDTLHQATHQARQYSLQATRFLDGIFSSLAADLRSQDDTDKPPSTDSDGPDAVALLSAAGSTHPSSRADPMHMLRALAAADASQQTPETLAKAASVASVTATPRRPSANYQPAFSYSLPIQLLVSGITLTLLVVLLIHLLFTTQYHYPLAPLNYGLQLASIISVLIGVATRIGVILRHASNQADHWPYALDYVSVAIPGENWTTAENAAWYLLQALSNGLANLTHIQFLTLLYPSRTEARLIFLALGPLAVASSGLFFCTMSNNRTVVDLGDAIRNVFSSTLLLIFTLSLCIWGFLVNRRRAWRLDGGTGVFGGGALGLAFVTTASSFVAVKEEGIDWLQHLIWAAVLWQTWLGWWWWVGAGMGIGEVEDIMERAIRKKKRAARRAHRDGVMAAQTPGANTPHGAQTPAPGNRRHNSSMGATIRTASTSVMGMATGIANFVQHPNGGTGSHSGGSHESATRRRGAVQRSATAPAATLHPDVEEGFHEDIELGSLRLREPTHERDRDRVENDSGGHPQSSNSETSSTSRTPSLHPPQTARELLAYPLTWFQVYLRRLRRAHEEATRRSAVEQAERRSRVPTIAGSTIQPAESWDLGAYGMREHHESTRRLHEAQRQLRANALLAEETEDSRSSTRRSRRARISSASAIAIPMVREPEDMEGDGARHDGDWEDVDSATSDDDDHDDPHQSDKDSDADADEQTARPGGSGAATPRAEAGGSTWSWWGPLKEWRLADRSKF